MPFPGAAFAHRMFNVAALVSGSALVKLSRLSSCPGGKGCKGMIRPTDEPVGVRSKLDAFQPQAVQHNRLDVCTALCITVVAKPWMSKTTLPALQLAGSQPQLGTPLDPSQVSSTWQALNINV
ncbi:hypothetical protein B0T10DRAFT_463835 [Thelonectria olida]|uniref:Uncharacterized protein n=1 Tax=Thelonectria olida TaxID=1576542 RepID=A0A9P9ALD0_9HYPO|nr:hypothetical protein B0T10DRAFT_463835 [Thelonectria olida]